MKSQENLSDKGKKSTSFVKKVQHYFVAYAKNCQHSYQSILKL